MIHSIARIIMAVCLAAILLWLLILTDLSKRLTEAMSQRPEVRVERTIPANPQLVYYDYRFRIFRIYGECFYLVIQEPGGGVRPMHCPESDGVIK